MVWWFLYLRKMLLRRSIFRLPSRHGCADRLLESEGADAEDMFAAAEVILAHPEELSAALAEVQELFRGQGALQTADELLEQWYRAFTS